MICDEETKEGSFELRKSSSLSEPAEQTELGSQIPFAESEQTTSVDDKKKTFLTLLETFLGAADCDVAVEVLHEVS
jgi:hypothetical protein